MITLTIDGRQISVAEGTTILEAARMLGINIPTLCYHPRLRPLGYCRLCLVAVEGATKPVAACDTPASDGMVVRTSTPELEAWRKGVLELILSQHPKDCLTCEKVGGCELQDCAYATGLREGPLAVARASLPVLQDNPFFVRDYNKCILCGRCVQVCLEVQGNAVLKLEGSGVAAGVTTAVPESLKESGCVFCGNCLQVCPVGALTERARAGLGREWEFAAVPSVCPFCGVGCNITLHVKDGRIVKVTGRENPVVNNGWLCVKGRFGWDYVHSPERLTKPLIRTGERGAGAFREATWDEALQVVAEKLREIKEEHGADALAFLGSAKCTNEENYLLQKLARAVIGTNNVDHSARFCHAPTDIALGVAFGSGAATNSLADLAEADCFLVLGSNPAETHPVLALRIKEAVRRGAKLVLIDPRQTELAAWAHLWLRPKPGTDLALLNGLLHVIINEGLYDQDFIAKRTEGFAELREVVQAYPPEKMAAITGVAAADIVHAARLYAAGPRSAILYGMGLTQHVTGTANVAALANLALACGQVGKEGSGIHPLRGQNNAQGACDMGALPDLLPGYQPVADAEARAKFADAWGVAALPALPGLTLTDMLRAAREGKLRGLFILGENLVLAGAGGLAAQEALTNLDFLVVQDIFLTETARLADVVLPGAAFAEKDGTFTSTERRVQLLTRALDPPGEARADWEVLLDLMGRLGYAEAAVSPREILAEIAGLVPMYAGITADRLASGGLPWPVPDRDHPGTPILYREAFAGGRGRFQPVHYSPPAEEPDAEYPFLLTTGRNLYHYHAVLTRRSPGLEAMSPEPEAEVNPADAASLGLEDGEEVELVSRRGRVRAKARVVDRVPKGMVFMSLHFREAAVNLLIGSALDPVAAIPEYKACAVRIEKSGG